MFMFQCFQNKERNEGDSANLNTILNPDEKKTSICCDNNEEKNVKHLSKALQYASLRDERFEIYEDETKESDDDFKQHSSWK